MSDKIRAPFSPEQVDALTTYQAAGFMHPFTCGGGGGPHSGVSLYAQADGWHCPVEGCIHRQDWAHTFMADRRYWPDIRTGREADDDHSRDEGPASARRNRAAVDAVATALPTVSPEEAERIALAVLAAALPLHETLHADSLRLAVEERTHFELETFKLGKQLATETATVRDLLQRNVELGTRADNAEAACEGLRERLAAANERAETAEQLRDFAARRHLDMARNEAKLTAECERLRNRTERAEARLAEIGETREAGVCCACGSTAVAYHNYRDQPFCAPCADGHSATQTRAQDDSGHGDEAGDSEPDTEVRFLLADGRESEFDLHNGPCDCQRQVRHGDGPWLAAGGWVSADSAPILEAGCTFPLPSRERLERLAVEYGVRTVANICDLAAAPEDRLSDIRDARLADPEARAGYRAADYEHHHKESS